MIEARCNLCALRKKPCFRPLSAPEVKFVSKMNRGQVSLASDRFLVKSGDIANTFYTLIEGWAALYLDPPNRPARMIDIVLPGDTVGIQGYLMGKRSYSIQALTPVRFCSLDGSRLKKLVSNQAEFGLAVIRHMAEEQSRRSTRSAVFGTVSPAGQLAYLFLETVARLKALGMTDGTMYPFPLRQNHLAELLGLSKVHINRQLAALKRGGLIHLADSLLVIRDEPGLADIAQFVPPVYASGRTII